MSLTAKLPTFSTRISGCSSQMIPTIPRKRSIHHFLAENSSLLREEPKAKKFKASELVEHPSKGSTRPKKSVTFSDDIKEIRFRIRDTPRSLLCDGIDDGVEDDLEDSENDPRYHYIQPVLQNITLSPQQRTLQRTISFQEFEFDDQFGEELDSQLTSMHLGEVTT
ncbi:hypothetical protein BC943DRAFT_359492 [Umbelopsis sp. AD052]|nr:hypothetical protein BC943DRAFT_359492 [Umbelopsis sp. AD052]